MLELETVMLTGKNYMTFDEQLYWDKQHAFDRTFLDVLCSPTNAFIY
jgi:hypothetical protein